MGEVIFKKNTKFLRLSFVIQPIRVGNHLRMSTLVNNIILTLSWRHCNATTNAI